MYLVLFSGRFRELLTPPSKLRRILNSKGAVLFCNFLWMWNLRSVPPLLCLLRVCWSFLFFFRSRFKPTTHYACLLVNRSVFLLFSVMQSKKKRKNKALELDMDWRRSRWDDFRVKVVWNLCAQACKSSALRRTPLHIQHKHKHERRLEKERYLRKAQIQIRPKRRINGIWDRQEAAC